MEKEIEKLMAKAMYKGCIMGIEKAIEILRKTLTELKKGQEDEN